MVLLVFGKSGQLAQELARRVPEAEFAGRNRCDLTRPGNADALIRRLRPDLVINAAAATGVERAEREPLTAAALNAQAPGEMARAAADLGIPLVHVSTDYVFSGTAGAPQAPDDPVGPLGTYGRTKLDGENVVRGAGGVSAILRTSWVFSAHGDNFVKRVLALGRAHPHVRIVDDQRGGPTPAAALAAAVLQIGTRLGTAPDLSGTYHLSGAPDTTWADFARSIFAAAGIGSTVEGIPAAAYPDRTPRPSDSRLDCTATGRAFGIARPDWRPALQEVLRELAED